VIRDDIKQKNYQSVEYLSITMTELHRTHYPEPPYHQRQQLVEKFLILDGSRGLSMPPHHMETAKKRTTFTAILVWLVLSIKVAEVHFSRQLMFPSDANVNCTILIHHIFQYLHRNQVALI
jgi:hypothetical protein